MRIEGMFKFCHIFAKPVLLECDGVNRHVFVVVTVQKSKLL